MVRKRIKEDEEDSVIYCSKCYSLKIVHENSIGADCCKECGCTDTRTTSFNRWEGLYQRRYGHKYLEEEDSIKKSPIYTMSISKLKTLLYKYSTWRDICKTMYTSFPEGLNKTDSIMLLFAKLDQDNRVDDLRTELIRRNNK